MNTAGSASYRGCAEAGACDCGVEGEFARLSIMGWWRLRFLGGDKKTLHERAHVAGKRGTYLL